MAMNMNDVKETSTTNDTRVLRIIPLNKKWVIRTVKDEYAYLATNDGAEWSHLDDEPCDELIMKQYVQMYDLLHAVNESTGPGGNEQNLYDALVSICTYMDNRSK